MFKESAEGRIWEIDFLRGVAIIFMVFFHLMFDMKEFFGYDVRYEGNYVYYIGRLSAVLFIFVSGISTSLSRSSLKRGLKVFGAALLITIVTYIFNRNYFVVFGILHFLGVCMLLSPIVGKLGNTMLFAAGTVIIILGYTVPLDSFSNNYLMFLGLRSQTFRSSDYYPLIPYWGIFLIGTAAGRLLYKNKKSLFATFPGQSPLSLAGRHSLEIYLLHQPAILLVLKLVSLL